MSDPLGKKWKWTLFSVCLVMIAILAYYIIPIIQFGMAIDKEPEESKYFKKFHIEDKTEDKNVYVPPEWESEERVNILLLGGDTRGLNENEVPRSDSMMVVSLDPATKKAYLFSILRDTYAYIPDHYNTRINAALALGGPHLAMETVSDFLDMPIQYYMYADFEGFVALVDALGGIEYEVEKDMYYTSKADGPEFDINLKEGLQELNGKMALQYVRFRYDAQGDYARTERQRKFLTVLADKMKSSYSLIRLPSTLKKITPYIETNISLNTMIKLSTLAYDAKAEGITSKQIPPAHLLREETIEGSAVITVDHNELVQFLEETFSQANDTANPELNNTSQSAIGNGETSIKEES
jgi:LCP family protein required for cell wall assembly